MGWVKSTELPASWFSGRWLHHQAISTGNYFRMIGSIIQRCFFPPPPPQAKTLLNQQKSLAEWSAGPRSSVDPRPYIRWDKLTFIDESLEYDCVCLQAFPEQEITSIHDFELHYSRRPKVLVQTAGHVAGATRYYQRKDVTCDPWRPSQVRGL